MSNPELGKDIRDGSIWAKLPGNRVIHLTKEEATCIYKLQPYIGGFSVNECVPGYGELALSDIAIGLALPILLAVVVAKFRNQTGE